MIKIIAEIGINHNGDLSTAMKLVGAAREAGCDFVKFQKRTPALCVPDDQKAIERDTPWGRITYLEYKERIEFGAEQYAAIDLDCIPWFASVWDIPSLDFMLYNFAIPYIKIPSAKLDDRELLERIPAGSTVILSTGMSTLEEIDDALTILEGSYVTLMHAVSAYPLENEDANLSAITTLQKTFGLPVGYSDHTRGLHMAAASVSLGVSMIEKHITLDRTMWGTDQAASIEPHALRTFVRNIRDIEAGMGSGTIGVQECELPAKRKLRG